VRGEGFCPRRLFSVSNFCGFYTKGLVKCKMQILFIVVMRYTSTKCSKLRGIPLEPRKQIFQRNVTNPTWQEADQLAIYKA